MQVYSLENILESS